MPTVSAFQPIDFAVAAHRLKLCHRVPAALPLDVLRSTAGVCADLVHIRAERVRVILADLRRKLPDAGHHGASGGDVDTR